MWPGGGGRRGPAPGRSCPDLRDVQGRGQLGRRARGGGRGRRAGGRGHRARLGRAGPGLEGKLHLGVNSARVLGSWGVPLPRCSQSSSSGSPGILGQSAPDENVPCVPLRMEACHNQARGREGGTSLALSRKKKKIEGRKRKGNKGLSMSLENCTKVGQSP